MGKNGTTQDATFYAIAGPDGETVAELALPSGYRLIGAEAEARAHRIGEACDVEDHAPCDINVSVGYVQELAEAEGLAVPAFDRLLAEGWDTPEDVVEALRAVQAAAPEAHQAEIAEVIGYVREAGGASR